MLAEVTSAFALQIETFKNLISSIHSAKIQLQWPQQQAIPPQSSPSTPSSTDLFSLEYNLYSHSHWVEVQTRQIGITNLPRSSEPAPPKSSPVSASYNQSSRSLKNKFTGRNSKFSLTRHIALTKDRLAKAKQPTEETSDNEQGQHLQIQSAEESDEDPADGDDRAANKVDKQVFKEMSVCSSVLLTKMYK
ncbi:hypothetical protein FRC02_002081 [Tulasnella sp. 418]|nr:hypothetical protein FRC02_002081 [Tulasnella sp. 418]